MRCILLFCLLMLIFAGSVQAAVEIAREGENPVILEEVYVAEGDFFLSIDDVLNILGRSGSWDSVGHLYRFKTPAGTAIISPGSHFVRLGERFIPLSQRPRFIDNRLRVSEDFITGILPELLGIRLYYRNLTPRSQVAGEEEGSSIDRLFAFLLQRKKPEDAKTLRAVALDPGHGGLDTGTIGLDGIKEKDVNLQVTERLEKILKMRLGIPVYLSRDGDYALAPQQRLEPATRADVDALILLHAQGSLRAAPQGIALVVRPVEEYTGEALSASEGNSMRLARSLEEALRQEGLKVDGIYQAPLPALGRGNLPTVLVEMGYLTNPDDKELLGSVAGREKLAHAMFLGLQGFAEKMKEKENK